MNDSVVPTGPRSPRRVKGRTAGQREDLVARLRDLAGAYPAGIGILKEFLQNADDAGATWVRFTLDLRTHPCESRPDERMTHLFGPALLVESDQTFTEQDVINIQRIGASGKIDDAGKTGRFGLGFNTVYSVTDYPSFATRDQIITFDPYFDTVAERGEEPGIDWSLEKLWDGGPDWPRTFGLPPGATWLETTVFRLPLRTAAQAVPARISRTPTHPEEMQKILESLADWGERLVLYLRSVVHVEARILHADGRLESLVDVRTTNAEVVQTARRHVLPATGESTARVLERAAEADMLQVYPHQFSVQTAGMRREDTWMVCQGLFLGEEGEVLTAAKAMEKVGEKAIPLGGAAVRVEMDGDGILPIATPGTLACTLPIPQTLPIALAVNARWSLSSARDHVRFGSDGGDEAAKIEWNRVLVEHVVSAAVSGLVEGIRDQLDTSGAAALYAALPDLRRLTAPFDQALGAAIYRALAAIPSVRVEDADAFDWRFPGEATLAPAWSSALIETCIEDNLELAVPVPPEHVLHGFEEVDEAPGVLTPAEAREWLKELKAVSCKPAEAPRACLRSREMVSELTRFCSENGKANLDGLPLAWMHDGTLRTFGHGDTICLGGDAARSLFRSMRTWFLDAEFERSGPVAAKQGSGLLEMSTVTVIRHLDRVLTKDRDDAWEPSGKGPLNEGWLTELYVWLTALPDLKSHLPALKTLAMVPDAKKGLVRPGTTGTPLLPTADMAKPVAKALEAFSVPMAAGSPALLTAIRAFGLAAGGMVWEATPNDVIDTLPDRTANFPTVGTHRAALLNWLTSSFEAKELSSEALGKLKALPLWPTQDGRFVAPAHEEVYLPDYEPPPGFTQVTLLSVLDAWRPLVRALGVPPLEMGAWIQRVFLKEYAALEPKSRAGALRWLRDTGLAAINGPDDPARKKLREALRDAPLIVATDGTLEAAARLYHPEARDEVKLLGPVARFPDWAKTYRSEPEQWSSFFQRLSLHRQPLDRDVVARVEQLVRDTTPENGDRTEAAMLEVYDFLEKRWSKSTDNDKTDLARKLRDIAWLPTMQRPAHTEDVALFKAPTARFLLPAKVHPPRLLNQAASQVAFMAGGREDAHVRQALGMPAEIPAPVALGHFIAVRDAWVAQGTAGLRHEAVARVASPFYRLLGTLAAVRGNVVMLNLLMAALVGSPCVWDPKARRFWKAEHAFAEGASWLGGLRGDVPTAGQEGAGLDYLGRRARPAPADLAAVLREMYATHRGVALPETLLVVAARCWHTLADTPDLLTPDLPVPTVAGVLVPAEDTLVDDASYWRDRLKKAELPWLHGSIQPSLALDAGAARASEEIEERQQTWTVNPPASVRRLCSDRQTHLESAAFNAGLVRLLAQANPGVEVPDVEDVRAAVQVRLEACGQITAGLICPRFGLEESVGIEEVACLLDNEDNPPKVWVASEEAADVALELSRALVRRLKEADIGDVDDINEAALEAILLCRTDQVQAKLDKRRVPSLVIDFETPDYADPEDAEWVDAESEETLEEGDDAEDDLEDDRTPEPPPRAPHTPINRPAGTTPAAQAGGSAPQSDVRPHPAVRQAGEVGAPPPPSDRTGTTPPPAGTPRPLPAIDAPPRERQPLTDRVELPTGSLPGDGPNRAPTVPHHGTSAAHPRGRGQFYSYLEATSPQGSQDTPAKLATERAALEHVTEVESGKGRRLVAMPRNNEGYDLEIFVPGEPESRIVEVKGLGGAWDARGVRVTPAELRAAHAFGDRYWLYVVEFAKESGNRRLYRVRNPAAQVSAYCVDYGWAALDETEAALVPTPGLDVYEGDTRVGVIVAVEERGVALRLTLESGTGERSNVTWNPARYHLRAGAA